MMWFIMLGIAWDEGLRAESCVKGHEEGVMDCLGSLDEQYDIDECQRL